ncbi:phage terminase large subunit [Paenibacillus naphthalenovorans]|uniref:phage terminase large subunit n=1 Tax=Paenibacillus naphthalenovorans TaxID=162209 RepID=UPI00088E9842|nr:phage terminase large subunit [Paenibacillus naphthalenovorans]SDJ61024.1 phage terminase, large subunit, PBSX family [Paenibacillus naphthalenovorans]
MGELKLKGYPNERQKEFFLSTARHIGYGGARGGGKSWAMRRKFVLLALKYPGLKLLLLRRTLPELRENHVLPLLSELHGFARYKDDEKSFVFPNGSRIKLGYCDTDKDVFQYQGQEYDVIGLEEATHFTEYMRDFFETSNRSTRTDFKPRMYYTSNPGGIGHSWFKRLFIDREYRGKEKPENYVFIPAKVYDNHALMNSNPEYVETLESLPDDQREAFLHGNWDVFAGQYFREWRRDTHVIQPFAIPKHWMRFCSMDWGYNDPCAVYWHAVNDRRVYTYRELYITQTNASDVARKIIELSQGENIEYTVASPDMWHKRGTAMASNGEVKGESIADIFMDNGVWLDKADNSRILGWNRMREYMKMAPDGMPYWVIFDGACPNLVRTLPQLIHHERNVEDVSDKVEDHGPESCRYGLMSRPDPTEQHIVVGATPLPNSNTGDNWVRKSDGTMVHKSEIEDQYRDEVDSWARGWFS